MKSRPDSLPLVPDRQKRRSDGASVGRVVFEVENAGPFHAILPPWPPQLYTEFRRVLQNGEIGTMRGISTLPMARRLVAAVPFNQDASNRHDQRFTPSRFGGGVSVAVTIAA